MMKKTGAALLMAAAVMFSACNGNTSAGSDPTNGNTSDGTPSQSTNDSGNGGTGIIRVAGSTSVAPLMKELKEAYESSTGVSVEIQETGSSAGITAASEGAADIGMSSRDLKDEEKEGGLTDTEIALDGIAVVVHPDNPVQSLTQEQIQQIYTGEISNWSELGGNDGTIIVVSREEGSGTRGAFEELLKLEGEVEVNGEKLTTSLVSDDALFESSTGAVKSNVASSANAIGYISLGALDDSVVAVDVDAVPCSVETVKNGSYAIARPFLICTMPGTSDEVNAFIDFILSEEGQAIVTENSYISIL